MAERDMKRAAKIVLATFGLLLAAGGIFGWLALRYPDALPSAPPRDAHLVVEPRMSLAKIARLLAERGVIEHPSWFSFYANERGLAQKIRAGQYTFSSALTPRQVLDKLVAGVPQEEVAVTIPEGKNLAQIAELLEQAGVSPQKDVLAAARDAELLRKLDVSGESLEGYLFPDTYRFARGTAAARALSAMVKRAHDVLAEVEAANKDAHAALKKSFKFGDREIVIMASLVEKETGQPEERPRIAGVFYNRLKLPTFQPHLLQTDPTIVYGCTVPLKKSAACQKFDGRIRRIHLEDHDNPYNTYTHAGLPPGPIANPGRKALEAAIVPEKSAYLYFVSKNDGTHQFSKTRAEHEAAVDKYQRHAGDGS
jgi:peptidoglycan lytic transglycosylase G